MLNNWRERRKTSSKRKTEEARSNFQPRSKRGLAMFNPIHQPLHSLAIMPSSWLAVYGVCIYLGVSGRLCWRSPLSRRASWSFFFWATRAAGVVPSALENILQPEKYAARSCCFLANFTRVSQANPSQDPAPLASAHSGWYHGLVL